MALQYRAALSNREQHRVGALPVDVEHVEVDAGELADKRLPERAGHAHVGLQNVQDRAGRLGILQRVHALLRLRHDLIPPLEQKCTVLIRFRVRKEFPPGPDNRRFLNLIKFIELRLCPRSFAPFAPVPGSWSTSAARMHAC